VNIGRDKVRLTSLQVDDDEALPYFTSTVSSGYTELQHIKEILNHQNILVHFFDERIRPVMSAECTLDPIHAKEALRLLSDTSPHYECRSPVIENKALDLLQEIIDADHFGEETSALMFCRVRINIQTKQFIRITEANKGVYQIDDEDEGGGLEQSAHGSLEIIFEENTYRSPIFIKGGNKKELADLLGFDQEMGCIIQAKATSVYTPNPKPKLERRVKNIENQIEDAVSQLSGATRNLRSGRQFQTMTGKIITISHRKEMLVHGIVLVSDMNPSANWQHIADLLIQASDQRNFVFFQAFDLEQFRKLCFFSRIPTLFHRNLMVRWIKMKKERNAL